MMLIPTRVAPSAIHGLGLFAVEFVPKGTPIWAFLAGFDQEFAPEQWAALPEPARSHTRHFCFVRRGDLHVILSGDHACFINHHDAPNTGALPDAVPPVTTVALRNIAAGEEITCNYWAYDADTAWKLGQVPPDSGLGCSQQSGPSAPQSVLRLRAERVAFDSRRCFSTLGLGSGGEEQEAV